MASNSRISVSFADAFPKGAFAVGAVEAVINFDASTKENRVQALDKESGLPLWSVDIYDADPESRTKSAKVKIAARTEPALPDTQSGSPFRAVEFDGLSITPYIVTGERPKIAYSYRATGLHAPARAAARPAPAGMGA
jgi:hypothetical protein